MVQLKYQSEVCLQAWLHCEDVLTGFNANSHDKMQLKQLINECADICLGMIEAIRQRSINTDKLAILCVGICEECAEVCERFQSSIYRKCADACRRCADALSHMAFPALTS